MRYLIQAFKPGTLIKTGAVPVAEISTDDTDFVVGFCRSCPSPIMVEDTHKGVDVTFNDDDSRRSIQQRLHSFLYDSK